MGRWQDLQDMIDNYQRRNEPNTSTVAVAVLAGAAAGLLAGIMLAPDSGQETRRRIKNRAQENVNDTIDKAGDAKDAATDKAKQAADTAKRAAREGKEAADEAREDGRSGRGRQR